MICGINKAKKSKAGRDALKKLKAYLNAASPEPVYFLTRLWSDQQQAITYKELTAAIKNGYLDEVAYEAWSNDYAVFVSEKLAPVWKQAMAAASAGKMGEHPGYIFDPQHKGVRDWITEHGAEWVTRVSDEQRQAMSVLIRRAAETGQSADALSRAIRPCIGLTERDASANFRLYQRTKANLLQNNPKMKTATAEKKARETAARYAAKQHRRRAYDIATTELAFAYNKGAREGILQAQEQGFIGTVTAQWSTAADERVCPICGALDGVEIGMEEEFNFPGKTLYGGQKRTPPAHPRCRCAVAYLEQGPPPTTAGTAEELPDWPGENSQEPPEPAAPKAAHPVPMPEGMRHKGKVNLGGTGEMYRYVDKDGREWLFKPAKSKSGTPERFRAYAQEAGYRVQYLVDPESAVPVGVGELGGRFGAFQRRITGVPGKKGSFNLEAFQTMGEPLPEGLAGQLQREHLTDWLLGNFDAHGGNFIVDDAGRLIGLDKEQAFKYIARPGSRKMSYSYHPNSEYGEREPVYNTLFRRFAKGELDLNLQDTLSYLKRVEAIPDREYREIFRGYAEELHGKGKAAEELLDQIVERKSVVRERYREFYADLLTERTGKKQTFVWADEAAELADGKKSPMAAVLHSPESLKKMNLTELKSLAGKKSIPYYHNMKKSELVTALSDPARAADMSAQVRERLKAATQRRAAKKPARTSGGILRAKEVFEDLDLLPRSRGGASVLSDRGMVEGLNLTGRKMVVDGRELYELSGKLSEQAWSGTWDRIKKDSVIRRLEFEGADETKELFSTGRMLDTGVTIKCRTFTYGDATFDLYIASESSLMQGWKGFFRLRVPATGNGAADAAQLRQLLGRVGLEELMQTPDAAAETMFKKARLLWQHDPKLWSEWAGLTGDRARSTLDSYLKRAGIDPARAGRMKMKQVFDGYSTLVEEGIASEYQKEGVRYLWAGVCDMDDVVQIVKGRGLISNNGRYRFGMTRRGASPEMDFKTGGSDNVFTRLGIRSGGRQRFSDSFMGNGYRILIDPKELERTDWYAYLEDSFGSSQANDLARRLPAKEFFRRMRKTYWEDNEIMFRHGIRSERFLGITCDSEVQRAALLDRLRDAGVKEINGIPIEQFVEVERYI